MASGNSSNTQRHTEELKDDLRETAQDVRRGVQEIGSKARQVAEEQIETLRETAAEYVEQGRNKALEWEDSLESQIRHEPMKSMLIAAGIGFVAGFLLLRR